MNFKNHFALTSRERNGFFAILFLCVLALAVDYYLRMYHFPPTADFSVLQDSVRAFYASAYEEDTFMVCEKSLRSVSVSPNEGYAKVVEKSSKTMNKKHKTVLHIEINTASKEDLMQIRGIGAFYAEQILSLRERYGGFLNLDVLQALYGMDSARLELWKEALYVDSTMVYEKLLLNSADSTTLAAIPCLSRYDAQRIVRYRERLGGFYTSQQLLEVYGIKQDDYEDIMLRAVLDTVILQKIDINNAAFKTVMRHPYIDSYENTKAIFRYLDLCPIASWDEFCKIPNLQIERLDALQHYLDFKPVNGEVKD